MIKIVSLLSALLFVSVPYESQAASGDQDFYKGKTIRIHCWLRRGRRI